MDFESIVEKRGFSCTWVIENFSYCWQKNGESISSPPFIIGTMEKSQWTLELYPKGDIRTKDFISFYLRRDIQCEGPESFEIYFKLSFLAVDGSVLVSTHAIGSSFTKSMAWGTNEFVKLVEVFQIRRKDFLPGDILTARCKIWDFRREITKVGHCFSRTRIGVEQRSFIWNIKNFNSFQRSICEITSVPEGNKIATLIFFSSIGQTNETDISVEILKATLKFGTLLLHVLDTSGNRTECLRKEITFDDDAIDALFTLTFSKEELIENKNLYLPNDVLTLQCECAFTTGIVWEEIEKISYGCPPSFQKENLARDDMESIKSSLDLTKILQENLETLCREELLCDVKLKTKTRTFSAHQCILSARSPVFKAMFTNDMKERNTECIYIEDLSDDAVHRMLLYIYTARVPDMQWESASHLYAAADKYEILSLKNKCSSFLKDNLCPDNACDLLILADMHQDQDLKSTVQDYILNHRGIFNTNEWKLFMKTNVQLAADLMYLKLRD